MSVQIHPVRTPQELSATRELLEQYAAWLRIDHGPYPGIELGFQNYAPELAGLPGRYAPPTGELFLATAADNALLNSPLGCVALAPLDQQGTCEMKRLYVRPSACGSGVGRALVTAALAAASFAGYREVLLDTLPFMTGAIAIYRSLGFHESAPYYRSPIPGTLYFSKLLLPPDLAQPAAGRDAHG